MHHDWLGLSEDDVVLHAGNINWTYTLGVGVLDPFACGATGAIYAGERDPGIWPALIERTRATIFAAVPSVYRQTLKYGDPPPKTSRGCATASPRVKRSRSNCSPIGAKRPDSGSTRRSA